MLMFEIAGGIVLAVLFLAALPFLVVAAVWLVCIVLFIVAAAAAVAAAMGFWGYDFAIVVWVVLAIVAIYQYYERKAAKEAVAARAREEEARLAEKISDENRRLREQRAAEIAASLKEMRERDAAHRKANPLPLGGWPELRRQGKAFP